MHIQIYNKIQKVEFMQMGDNTLTLTNTHPHLCIKQYNTHCNR